MDQRSFDRLARLVGTPGTRRTALAALLGAGVAGTLGLTEAKKKRRRRKKSSGGAYLSAEAADCLSPGPGTNLDGCHFAGQNLAGVDWSSSFLRGTNFTGANLTRANLSSSNARGASFFRATLCGTDLRSSTLRNVDFTGANLTGANLASSACGGADFTNAIFCRTRMCTGTVRNPGCTACCADADCPSGQVCINRGCVPRTSTACTNETCEDCGCLNLAGGGTHCANTFGQSIFCPTCSSAGECEPGEVCAVSSFFGGRVVPIGTECGQPPTQGMCVQPGTCGTSPPGERE